MAFRHILVAASWAFVSGTAAAGTTLFDSFAGIDPPEYAVVSSAFTDAVLGGFQTAAADDFTVADSGWRIDRVRVQGNYSDPLATGNLGPASSVNVYFVPKTGAVPTGTNLSGIAVWSGQNLAYTDAGSGDFEISLPDVILPGGDYWLVVQANIELFAAGQWNWSESSLTPNSGTTRGDESSWFQSAAGVASPITGTATCVGAWGTRVTGCQMSRNPDTNPPYDRDFAFAIDGQLLVAGATVSPLNLVTTENGSAVTYSVVLDAPPAPSETVTVTPSSNDVTEGTVSGALLFDSVNWSVPQSVTVTPGAAGDGNDGDVSYNIENLVSSNLPAGNYVGVMAPDVAATNNNIDGVATVIVDPASAVTVSEDGLMTALITIEAGSDIVPSSDVTIALTNSNPADISLSTSSVVLNAGNGYSSTVTISGVADTVREVTEAFNVVTAAAVSADVAYSGVNPADITGTVLDNNVVDVTVTASATPLNLIESGASASIGYVLTAEPMADVSFTLSSSDTSEAVVSGPATLTFTAANWNVVQSVSIAPVDDTVVDGSQAFSIVASSTSSADPFWNNVAIAAVTGNVADNDSAAIGVDIGDGIVTSEDGGNDSFTVVLGAAPAAEVAIDVRSDDPGEGLLSRTGAAPFAAVQTLTFTAANWNVPQTITVAGQDDGIVDGDQAYTIVTENIVSTAVGYSALTDADVADVPAINIGRAGVPTAVPTLSNTLLGLLSLLMAGFAAAGLRYRHQD